MRFRKRRIRNGDTYSIDEDVELKEVEAVAEIPVEIQGEPWAWTKGPPFPLDYGRRNPDLCSPGIGTRRLTIRVAQRSA